MLKLIQSAVCSIIHIDIIGGYTRYMYSDSMGNNYFMKGIYVNTKIEALKTVGALKEALLAQNLGESKMGCNICQRRCRIPEGGVGYCRTVINHAGTLYTTIYGVISSAAADPIEKKPVFHFKPGSKCFSVGSLGCNFRCVFCQNWEIAFADAVKSAECACKTGVSPEKLVEMAIANNCEGVAWTYNEPSIWLNYTLDCAKLCKQAGLYTVYVTNGYATPEHLDMIGPYLDVYRVDIKSIEEHFHHELTKVPSVQGILDVAVRAKVEWGTPTPPETLDRALQIGKESGLQFVYLGNIQTDAGENTYCPTCGNLAVQRSGYTTKILGLTESGTCSVDGTDLNIRV
ncbi:MAG: radical SAM protein [Armatimonadetes bacterium]|nr:radical SAM protein [Armatimonadota bacterium]